jgi:hypothetical protein
MDECIGVLCSFGGLDFSERGNPVMIFYAKMKDIMTCPLGLH